MLPRLALCNISEKFQYYMSISEKFAVLHEFPRSFLIK